MSSKLRGWIEILSFVWQMTCVSFKFITSLNNIENPWNGVTALILPMSEKKKMLARFNQNHYSFHS